MSVVQQFQILHMGSNVFGPLLCWLLSGGSACLRFSSFLLLLLTFLPNLVESRLGKCRIAIEVMEIGRQVRVVRNESLIVFQGSQLIIFGRFEVSTRIHEHRILIIRAVLLSVSSPAMSILIRVEWRTRSSNSATDFILSEAEIRPLTCLIHVIGHFPFNRLTLFSICGF